jgi:hypothetical protein
MHESPQDYPCGLSPLAIYTISQLRARLTPVDRNVKVTNKVLEKIDVQQVK